MNDQERLNKSINDASKALAIKYGSVMDDYYGLIFMETSSWLAKKTIT